jgi:hypothetical protein
VLALRLGSWFVVLRVMMGFLGVRYEEISSWLQCAWCWRVRGLVWWISGRAEGIVTRGRRDSDDMLAIRSKAGGGRILEGMLARWNAGW